MASVTRLTGLRNTVGISYSDNCNIFKVTVKNNKNELFLLMTEKTHHAFTKEQVEQFDLILVQIQGLKRRMLL